MQVYRYMAPVLEIAWLVLSKYHRLCHGEWHRCCAPCFFFCTLQDAWKMNMKKGFVFPFFLCFLLRLAVYRDTVSFIFKCTRAKHSLNHLNSNGRFNGVLCFSIS
uniref:Uncharacterized protein n=1 Tax=Trypanosoma congolense (strain IL3000) TaxID=1068625 RepID=G0UTY1_TRYCI|nr:hypothetical protein, unlikely [Trypanosoma congolense IL3000]